MKAVRLVIIASSITMTILAPCYAAPRGEAGSQQAMALLKKNRDAMLALRSYSARCQMVQQNFNGQTFAPGLTYQSSALIAVKPNKMLYQMWETAEFEPKGAPDFAVVSNGKKLWMQSHMNYWIHTPDPKMLVTIMEPWDGFYTSEGTLYEKTLSYQQSKSDITVKYLGREKLDGDLLDKVETDEKELHAEVPVETKTLVYLREDGLVRRQVQTYKEGSSVSITTTNLLHIVKTPDVSRQSFAYTPPIGATLLPTPNEAPDATSQPSLLQNGTQAPDFVAKLKNGKEVNLSDLKGKVVILDFWASWCVPCAASMPLTQMVAQKLQEQGLPVQFLAVDDEDTIDAFSAWVTKNAGKYPNIDFAYSSPTVHVSSKLFKVTGIPTQYVIDANGTVRATFIGYSGENKVLEKSIRDALPAK